MNARSLIQSLAFLLLFFVSGTLHAENCSQVVSLRVTDKGCDVSIDGKPFAGYVFDCQGTPIIWPIIGPTGKRMTRDYPMIARPDETEAKDHPHHRSLWFTHGNVSGSDFWLLRKQKIVQKDIFTECDGKTAVITTKNDWIGKDGRPLCVDVRELRFGALPGRSGEIRYIDFNVTVTAVQDEVIFGDTKEGTFGIRVPGTMDLTAKKRDPYWGGHIVNAEGVKDGSAWGKRSAWVDYSGPVVGTGENSVLGIAILNHPSSFRYPTYWHVRDYGLFAANPFGVHDFESKKEKVGEHRMKKGESFTIRYRILFHQGDAATAGIADAFKNYAEMKFE